MYPLIPFSINKRNQMEKTNAMGLIGLDYTRGVDRSLLSVEILHSRLQFEDISIRQGIGRIDCELIGVIQLNGKNILHAQMVWKSELFEILTEITDDEMSNIAIDLYNARQGELTSGGEVIDFHK